MYSKITLKTSTWILGKKKKEEYVIYHSRTNKVEKISFLFFECPLKLDIIKMIVLIFENKNN